MPETPDFDQIARRVWTDIDGSPDDIADDDEIASIVTVLRQVWNARGAADLARIDTVIGPGSKYADVGAWLLKYIDRALRALDR